MAKRCSSDSTWVSDVRPGGSGGPAAPQHLPRDAHLCPSLILLASQSPTWPPIMSNKVYIHVAACQRRLRHERYAHVTSVVLTQDRGYLIWALSLVYLA